MPPMAINGDAHLAKRDSTSGTSADRREILTLPLKIRASNTDRRHMRRVGVFLAGIVMFAGLTTPAALAAAANGGGQPETGSSVESDIAAIEAIVAEAESAMSAVVAAFDATVQQASTTSAVQKAASSARQEVTDISNKALSEIREIESGKPGALQATADAARAAVVTARDAALASIASIQSGFVAPTPPTTLPPNAEPNQGGQSTPSPTSQNPQPATNQKPQPGANQNSVGNGQSEASRPNSLWNHPSLRPSSHHQPCSEET